MFGFQTKTFNGLLMKYIVSKYILQNARKALIVRRRKAVEILGTQVAPNQGTIKRCLLPNYAFVTPDSKRVCITFCAKSSTPKMPQACMIPDCKITKWPLWRAQKPEGIIQRY